MVYFDVHVFFVFSCCSLLGVGDMWRKPFTKHRWFRKKTRGFEEPHGRAEDQLNYTRGKSTAAH